MSRRANLFHSRKKQSSFQAIQLVVRVGSAIAAFLLFALIIVFILQYRLKQTEQNLSNEKSTMLTYIADNKDIEAKILFFAAKKTQLDLFAKDDANFVPYYTLLQSVLLGATGSPTLRSMTLDKAKNTEFVVTFPDFQRAYEFLRSVEMPSFLDKFSKLTLDSFVLVQNAQSNPVLGKEGYELHLSGTFYDIPTNK